MNSLGLLASVWKYNPNGKSDPYMDGTLCSQPRQSTGIATSTRIVLMPRALGTG